MKQRGFIFNFCSYINIKILTFFFYKMVNFHYLDLIWNCVIGIEVAAAAKKITDICFMSPVIGSWDPKKRLQ